MKKFVIFFIFFVYSFMAFANNNDSIVINNFVDGDKIKIFLLKPCIVVKEENDNTTIDDNIDNEENFKTKKTVNIVENNTDVFNIEDIGDNEDEDEERNEESYENDELVNNKPKTKELGKKMIFQNYSSVNLENEKKKGDRLKKERIIDGIYSKIIDNLEITKLYTIDYNRNSCQDMTNFFSNKGSMADMSDYIFSDDLIENDFVVNAELEEISETEIKIQLFLWDVLDEKFVAGKYYILQLGNGNNSYRISNMISDFIFKATTGEKDGLFDSKVMYISETGSALNREKQIAIMNFDGSKNTKITKNKNMKLIPIFSKYNPNEIFYMEYLPEGPFIVRHNLEDNTISKILTKGQIMTSAANFNPNGENQLILAGTDGKSTNLFLFDFQKKTNRQITTGNNINTSPSFSPDGKKIVYVSDKSGSRKLYIKDIENDKEELLTKETGVYDKPSWSPDGKLIAFIKLKGQQFHLGIMNYKGEAERILASSYLIEGVKWSPNSRFLIYTKQKGAYGVNSIPRIYIKDIMTGVEYRLQTPVQEGASDPDWIMNK